MLIVNSSIVSDNDGTQLGGPAPGTGGIITPGGGTEFDTTGVANSDFYDMTGNNLAAWITPGQGNIFTDPLLDPVTFVPEACSPTIDTADPALAVGQEPKPNGGLANMGHTGTTPSAARSPADVTGDGEIDGVDVVRISVAFGSMTGEPRFNSTVDFDDSGLVDGADLAILASDFGLVCP